MFTKVNRWMEDSFTSVQFSYKELRGMFGTLVLDQFFIMFINLLSTAMVSSTGEAAMAASNMVNSINSLVVLLFSSMAVGGSIIIARAKGSGDARTLRYALGETIALSGTLGIVLGGLLYILSAVLVESLYPQAEPLLIEYSIHFMHLVCISFPFYAIFNAIFYAFRSLGDTRSALLLTIVVNVLHLICSFIFINLMQLGITGAGLSFIVARGVGCVLALLWLLAIHNKYEVRIKHLFHFSRKISQQIIKLAVPIASESVLLQGGMLLVQIYLALLSTSELAAHGVANSYLLMYFITGNSLTSLASTICGQCYGAKQYDLLRKYNAKLIQLGRFIMLGTVLILTPLSPILLQLYSPTEQAAPIINVCLIIVSLGLPILWCDSGITPMTLRAAGDVIYSTVVSVVTLFLCRIALGYYLTIVLGMGVPGVWVAMMVEWFLRAILLRIRVQGNKWLKPQE